MQRQSLGSPGSRLQIHGGGELDTAADDETKTEKLNRLSPRSERSIHLIPLLTFLCFLILYLVSHDPSPADLPSMGSGPVRAIDHKVLLGEEVRSHRGLKAAARPRRNRKLVTSGVP